jgi:class 3 adenylate cyclase
MRTRNLTIVITDVKGYTERQSRSSRKEIEDELRRHRALLAPIFQAFGGRVVKTMGDAFLVAFESPTDAVHASVQVQKALAAENNKLLDPGEMTQVRIAVSTGEVSEDHDGDVFGEPVNVAARLQNIAEPGTVYLTETTFLSMNRNEIPALEVGHRVFKGIPDEVKVYRIVDEYVANARLMSPEEIRRVAHAAASAVSSSPNAAAAAAASARRGPHPAVWLVAGAILALGGGAAVYLMTNKPSEPEKPPAIDTTEQALAALRSSLPKLPLQAARWVKSAVDRMVGDGQWDKARELARKAYDAAPTSEPARDLQFDVSRWELEAAVRADRADVLVKQSPPTWYDQNVQGLYDKFHDIPRYEWLRAVWFLASDPTRASTAELAEKALKANADARTDETMKTLLTGAVAATTGNNLLHSRYVTMLDRMEKPAAGPGPTPGGRRPTGGQGMR